MWLIGELLIGELLIGELLIGELNAYHLPLTTHFDSVTFRKIKLSRGSSLGSKGSL